ncbi:UNVERIFIED_CONTAM: hypothetical protein PYX00_003458 [Menopon gallinae]|uniref:HMG box domain-containing protein n=1 Tax=Menopon gallinae TaxID=328185 RepID=A0AAW2I1P6_9NEOP
MEPMEFDLNYVVVLNGDASAGEKFTSPMQTKHVIIEDSKGFTKLLKNIKKENCNLEENYSDGKVNPEQDRFIKFYLRIYRELCGKMPIHEISKEVSERWNAMKRKPKPKRKEKAIKMELDTPGYEREDKDQLRERYSKVKLALMKQRIVSMEMKRLFNFVKRLRRERKQSAPFLKVFLNVLRGSRGKRNFAEIMNDGKRGWRKASSEKKIADAGGRSPSKRRCCTTPEPKRSSAAADGRKSSSAQSRRENWRASRNRSTRRS